MGRLGRFGVAVLGACLAAASLLGVAGSGAPAGADTACDALCTRVRSELKTFTGWLTANNAKGYIGEVGWSGTADAQAWNNLAGIWYRDADAAGLWVTQWATGEWWPNTMALGSYKNAVSEGAALDTALAPAAVVEAHPTAGTVLRGVNVNGGEFGAPSWSQNTASFSNKNVGTYDQAWHYDTQGSLTYLASRGIKLVRLPFRWERLQPNLGTALDPTELQRIKDFVGRANAAGIKVIPTAFNYGGYMLSDGTQGVRQTIGTAAVTNAHFADLWSRLSQALKGNPGLAGYGLMNEPAAMTAASGLNAAQTWEKASQAAVNAIRAAGDTSLVLVPGYNFSGAAQWKTTHPTAWITDSANNFRYEAHHYWDRDSSGAYANSYAAEVSNAQSRGFTATTITDGTGSTTTTTAAPPILPTLKVNDRSVAEGGKATFTVTLSTTSKVAVSLAYTTVNGTATAGADYLSKSGTLTIAAGATSATVAVSTVNDTTKEGAETFRLQLSQPVNATIADGSGTATIAASD
ncbi:MAG: endoglucanase [Actinomycetota bacterium]|jgi:aryl-phospho-beta-D-glucosidase BglC (GH1 family)|nr:endoglucanase [Actinomycetota bacterium]